jgi:hypothetical protein
VATVGGNDVPADTLFLIEAALSVAAVLRGERRSGPGTHEHLVSSFIDDLTADH